VSTISTPEELAALPELAVVLDAGRMAWQHIEDFDFGPLHWRNAYNEIRDEVRLPATVLGPIREAPREAASEPIEVRIVEGTVSPAIGYVGSICASGVQVYRKDTYPKPVVSGHFVIHEDGTVRFKEGSAYATH
jgi:hypothetical protein